MDPVAIIASFPKLAQGSKQLVRYAATALGFLLLVQLYGFENLVPAVPVKSPLTVWETLGLFVLFTAAEYMLGDLQERAKADGSLGSTPPPAP